MKTSLGKGLQSLIPKKQPGKKSSLAKAWLGETRPAVFAKESIFNIEIDKIRPNPYQPRKEMDKENLKELADSIREHGVLQPLIVSKVEKQTKRGRDVEYELVAGERRWRAARIARLPHVPVIIRGSVQEKKLELALAENVQREDLNSLEMALAFRQLQDKFGLKHNDIAKKVGKNRATVTNTLRLLTLPEKIQRALGNSRISEGHARAILMAKPAARIALFNDVTANNLSVRQAEDRARALAVVRRKKLGRGPKSPLFKALEKDLEKVIGRRTSITQRGDLGHLRIEFVSQGELDRLVKYLLKFKT